MSKAGCDIIDEILSLKEEEDAELRTELLCHLDHKIIGQCRKLMQDIFGQNIIKHAKLIREFVEEVDAYIEKNKLRIEWPLFGGNYQQVIIKNLVLDHIEKLDEGVLDLLSKGGYLEAINAPTPLHKMLIEKEISHENEEK